MNDREQELLITGTPIIILYMKDSEALPLFSYDAEVLKGYELGASVLNVFNPLVTIMRVPREELTREREKHEKQELG